MLDSVVEVRVRNSTGHLLIVNFGARAHRADDLGID